MNRRFALTDDGIRAELPVGEAELLEMIPELLRQLDPKDPAYARLHPDAYPADADADREFRRLVAREAEAARRHDQSAFGDSLSRAVSGTVLTRTEIDAWLRVLDEARLVLAVRLGIELGDEEPAESDASLVSFYDYLTWLQGNLVDLAASGLEPS